MDHAAEDSGKCIPSPAISVWMRFLPTTVAVVPFTLARLAFVAAIMAALPDALNRFLPFLAGLESAFPLILAQRAF